MSSVRSKQSLEGDDGLGPGQRGAGTGVDAVAERDVLAAVLPVQAELAGSSNSLGSRLAALGSTITV